MERPQHKQALYKRRHTKHKAVFADKFRYHIKLDSFV